MNERCRAGESCRALTSDGAAITTRPLCHSCVDDIQVRLDQLPAYWQALHSAKAKSLVPQGAGTKVQGSADPGTPLQLHVVDLIDEISQFLAWVDGVRVADLINRPLLSYERRYGGRILEADGVYLALGISRLWGRAEAQIGLQREYARRFGECPSCDQPSLGAYIGDDTIVCSTCGDSMSWLEYRKLTLKRARDKKGKR